MVKSKGIYPHRGAAARVKEMFLKRTGEIIYMRDIQEALGSAPEQTVRNAISYLMRTVGMEGLEVAVPGRAWVYKPSAASANNKPSMRVFQEVGSTKDGRIVLEGEDNKLYVAQEL